MSEKNEQDKSFADTVLLVKPSSTKDTSKMANAPQSLFAKYSHITGVVALYWSVSISMVFLNKYLLKSDSLQLDAPFFVTWYQCVMTVALSLLCSLIAKKNPKLMSFPSTKFDMKLSREVLPLSVVFVAMITFNNLCLKEVGVAFYTVSRSLVTLFSIIFTFIILGKSTTRKALACCCIVLGGFLLGVKQESLGEMSSIGVIYGVVASAFVALNAIYIKKVLPSMDGNVWRMAYYNNMNACVIFLPMILYSEVEELLTFPSLYELSFWTSMSASGIMGFGMGYVVGLEIKVTTPVTHTISGVAKACLQTVIAVLWYHETKTSLWWFANLLVLFGTASYSFVKSLDMKKQHESEKSNRDDEVKQPLV